MYFCASALEMKLSSSSLRFKYTLASTMATCSVSFRIFFTIFPSGYLKRNQSLR